MIRTKRSPLKSIGEGENHIESKSENIETLSTKKLSSLSIISSSSQSLSRALPILQIDDKVCIITEAHAVLPKYSPHITYALLVIPKSSNPGLHIGKTREVAKPKYGPFKIYSEDLNTKLVWYSSGWKEVWILNHLKFEIQKVWYSNDSSFQMVSIQIPTVLNLQPHPWTKIITRWVRRRNPGDWINRKPYDIILHYTSQ